MLVRDGEIAEIGAPGTLDAPDGAEVIDGQRPAPVPGASSTRTCTCARPGQEHKEDLETGTRAAAAGGFVRA